MKQSMTCEEFYNTGFDLICDEMIQEQYWQHGVDTEAIYNEMVVTANLKGVELSDLETFDDDRFFYNVYKYTEKGLS